MDVAITRAAAKDNVDRTDGWHQGRATTTLGSWAGERARCSGSGYLNDGLEDGIMALAIGNRYERELVEIKSADRPVLVAGRDVGPVSLLCRLDC